MVYGQVVEAEQIFPRPEPRPLSSDIPPIVRSLVLEGAQCESHGLLRASAGMYRAAVEAMLTDLQVPAGRLFNRINKLVATRPEVDPDLADRLHEARALGNYSLHEGMEFSSEEVADVAELIGEALHLIYVQPAERSRMRESRRAREASSKVTKE